MNLSAFISFPTISVDPIIDFVDELAERGEMLGGTVHRLQTSPTKQNLLIQFGEPSADGICLCGHMDVVPVVGQNWSRDQFQATIKDARLYGRGSCDMKGFIAIVYSLLEQLPLHNLKKGLTLAFTHDEEIGCVGADHMREQLKSFDLPIPKAMLIGEPTSLDICHHHGGHSTIVLKIKGRAAHSPKPHLGISPIIGCFNLGRSFEWNHCLQKQTCSVSIQHRLLISLRSKEEAINIIPENAEIHIGIRPMPEHNIHDLLKPLYVLCFHTGTNCEKAEKFGSKKSTASTTQKLPDPLEQAIEKNTPRPKH